MDETIEIFPTVEELSSVNSRVKCPQVDCKSIFSSSSNLNMHLYKHHKIESDGLSKKNQTFKFHCPVKTCIYHRESKKCFVKLKYLKQHFLKVHAVKKYECRTCGKKFSTEAFKNLHLKACGKLFACICGVTYTSSEAILTHCKRKGRGHSVMESGLPQQILKTGLNQNKIVAKKNERFIYPKLASDSVQFPIHYIAAIALSELSVSSNLSKAKDVAIQTDTQDSILLMGIKNNHLKPDCKKRKSSQQTQTVAGKNKNLKISAETQTNNDYLKSKQKNFQKLSLRKRKKSMETQTKEQASDKIVKGSKGKSVIMQDKVGSKHPRETSKWFWDGSSEEKGKNFELTPNGLPIKNDLPCINDGLKLNFVKREMDANLNQYNSAFKDKMGDFYVKNQGTVQQMFDINRLCNIETQTEVDNFLTECSNDTSFTMCSTTETQTTDDFDSLLYSHMCTQTSEDVDQLFDFNFVDIETQTAWPDLSD